MVENVERLESVDDVLEALRPMIPDSIEYIKLLFEILADFEESDFYTNHPAEVAHAVDDIDEIAEEIEVHFRREKDQLEPDDITSLLGYIYDLKGMLLGANIYKHFLTPIFKACGLTTQELPQQEDEVHVFNRFRVPNMNIKRRELDAFYTALDLIEDTKGGKGAHTKWSDPKGEMTGFETSSDEGLLWIKNVIKSSLQKGMPIERIELACRKCNISFQRK